MISKMKKISIILSVVLAGAIFVSCDKSESYNRYSFFSFETGNTLQVKEDGGSVSIPIRLYNSSKGGTVTVQGIDGTAVSGTNYSISDPASGVLTFSPGDTVKYVTISILDNPGVYTGSLDFSLQLKSTDDVQVGNFDTYNIVISDNDHPLSSIIGTYTATATALTDGNGGTSAVTWTLHLSADSESTSVLWCDYILPMFSNLASAGDGSIYCDVSDDLTTLSFPNEQSTQSFDVGYGVQAVYASQYFVSSGDNGFYVFGVADGVESINFTRTDDTSTVEFVADIGYCCLDQYVWPSYGGWLLGPNDGDYEIKITKVD
jgi:hypothetical protein